MADFSSGVRLKHLEWLGLMTNLIYLKGGQQFFKDTLEKYEEKYGDISRKFEQMSWAKKNNCHSYRCDSYCPYDDVCSHGSNMCYTVTSREVRKIHEDIEYTDLETMRKNISDAITESMKNSGINVIKAPTGAGKTYAYLQAVLNSEKRCIVAVPTSRLMREIAEKACLMGVKTICTPLIHELLSHLDNELSDYINYLYSIGDDGGINYLLRENRNFYVDNYLNQIENLRRFDGKLIVTTHARLLNMKADFLNARNVIIDEDILPFMMQIERCSVQDLENLQFSLYNAEIKPDEHIYSKLSEIQKVNGYEILKPMNYDITNEDKFAVNCCINSKNWTSNIYHALYAECFYHAENSDDILFLNVRTLPESAFTIVSATADEMIYRNIFGDRISYFYDLGMVKNTGKLILHCDKSYSHDCLLNEPEIIDNLRKKHSDCNIITFREFAQKNEVYLGASHGFNKFEGENLAVMGTFHRPEYVYKLWAMYMTGSTSFCGDVLAVRNIRRNGFSFKIMTYKEELLRNIQLWMIQSESEQAVGRARLLNNDCTVHLYSNLPLRQGELYG
ncbi:MAG: DEAD/DEAH box helicase family protein [Ruminococcus sp.]|nr:DEAD/DEAH box helicase family protein [Ruminococcus sp.]